MGYINGKEVLPEGLIKEIQQYVDGENIYIPRKQDGHRRWGENTDTKRILKKRNAEIAGKYFSGIPVATLSAEYHITTQGIYKIIAEYK